MKKIIEYFGGQSALAALLGCTRKPVHEWAKGRRQIPAYRAIQIEKLSAGHFKAINILEGDYE